MSWPASGALQQVAEMAWLGCNEGVTALRPLTGDLVSMGVWAPYFDLFPCRTTSGIAASCASDWSAAEQHQAMREAVGMHYTRAG